MADNIKILFVFQSKTNKKALSKPKTFQYTKTIKS